MYEYVKRVHVFVDDRWPDTATELESQIGRFNASRNVHPHPNLLHEVFYKVGG